MKKKVSYNIDIEINDKFNKLVKKRAINKSQLIENFISKWIMENK